MQNKMRDCLESFKELTTTVLLVNNVSRNLSKTHLLEIFSQYGILKGVYIPRDEENKVFKNYAFLEYVNKEDAEKACDYMGEGQIDGLKIRIKFLHPPEETKQNPEEKNASQTNENFLNNQNDYQNKESSYNNKGYYRRRQSRSRSKRKSYDYKSRHYDSRRYYRSKSRSRSRDRRYSRKRDNHYSNANSSRSSSHSSNHKSEKYSN
jgi:RNA-binding protein with serine-rich domain 1